MPSFRSLENRMIRAARLDVDLHEEVEADTSANGQAFAAVVIASLSSGLGTGILSMWTEDAPAFWVGLVIGLDLGFVVGVVFSQDLGWRLGLTGGMVSGLASGLGGGLVGGMIGRMISGTVKYGGADVARHYLLRRLLARGKRLPHPISDRRLVAYLDDMAGRGLLRRAGGGWMFIHRYLLEFFADQST